MPGHTGRNESGPRATHHVHRGKTTIGHPSHCLRPPHLVTAQALRPAVSANVINYSSPGVGENAIDPGVPPLATGVREQEDILQSIEVPVGGWVTAHQHGFQEGVPLGSRQ